MKKVLFFLFILLSFTGCYIESLVEDTSGVPRVVAPAPYPYYYRIYPNCGSPYYSPYFYHPVPPPPGPYKPNVNPAPQPHPNPVPSQRPPKPNVTPRPSNGNSSSPRPNSNHTTYGHR